MHLLQLALTQPRFDDDAVARVRAQIIQSLQQDEAEPPRRRAPSAFMRAFFNGHAYGHPVDGERAASPRSPRTICAAFARTPLGARRLEGRGGGRHRPAGADHAAGQHLRAAARRDAAAAAAGRQAGRARRACDRRWPVPQPTVVFGLPGIMRARSAISFPPMSPITFWAAAAFPRA